MNFQLSKFGLGMIVLGTIGFLAAVIISFTKYSGLDNGALPSASFLSILLGMAFSFPSLLKGPGPDAGFSTMRIVVFAIVLLFCTIYMKIGWSLGKMEELTIDQRWVYILGLAFGSKAFQSFSESDSGSVDNSANNKQTNDKALIVEETDMKKVTERGKDTSHDLL